MSSAMSIQSSGARSHGVEPLSFLAERLSRSSVAKRHEAFRDVDWTATEARVDRFDARFRLPPGCALGATEWYRSLTEQTQAEFGLEWICQTLRYGVAFEQTLSAGLLESFRRCRTDRPSIAMRCTSSSKSPITR